MFVMFVRDRRESLAEMLAGSSVALARAEAADGSPAQKLANRNTARSYVRDFLGQLFD